MVGLSLYTARNILTWLGLTLVAPITRGHALKASYSIGSVNDNDEDFYVFTLSYQHIF